MGGGGRAGVGSVKSLFPWNLKGGPEEADSEVPALSISAVQVFQGWWAPVDVALKALTRSLQLIGL